LAQPTPIFFWNIEGTRSPIEASLWTLNDKIETNVFLYVPPFQFMYKGVQLGANQNEIEQRCYWERVGGTTWEPGEHDGNTLRATATKKTKNKKQEKNFPHEKSWTPHVWMLSLLIGCMRFLFHNCLSPFLAWGTNCGTWYWISIQALSSQYSEGLILIS